MFRGMLMEEAQNNPETTCTGVREHLHRTSSKKPNTRSHLAVRGGGLRDLQFTNWF